MLRMLNRYRDELGVAALPNELEASALRTEEHLKSSSARLSVVRAEIGTDRLNIAIRIDNLAGHKLPTGYPSRRSWIHFTVRDSGGQLVFESGRLKSTGSIAGNNNDDDPGRYEPHYDEITEPDEVQIYESVMVDPQGRITTGLLSAVNFVKDNRLLPRGFDKTSAGEAIAVHGAANSDSDFGGGSDTVRYTVDITDRSAPFSVHATLWYQPIGFRWANNLKAYDAPETNRFVEYFDSMAHVSGLALAHVEIVVPDS